MTLGDYRAPRTLEGIDPREVPFYARIVWPFVAIGVGLWLVLRKKS